MTISTFGYKMATILLFTLFFIFEAGCGNILGHNNDANCETCDGSIVGYKHIQATFKKPNLHTGYNYVTTIPVSAFNISIFDTRGSQNHIALRNINGSFVLNGDYLINQPGNFRSCGTTFEYHRVNDHSDSTIEQVWSSGPLREPVELVVLKVKSDIAINYEYQLPIIIKNSIQSDYTANTSSVSANHLYHSKSSYAKNATIISLSNDEYNYKRHQRFNYYDWRHCYKSCENEIVKDLVCIVRSNEIIVSDIHCSLLRKPYKVQENYKCNSSKTCLPEWVPSQWSSCSGTCGECLKHRVLYCKQFNSHGYPITEPHEACGFFSTPAITEKCHLMPCNSSSIEMVEQWEVGIWSKCSSSCGIGIRTRQVICRSNLCPSNNVPITEEPCNSICSKQNGIWLTSDWNSQCSENCGRGWDMRNVICYNGEKCEESERPETYRACDRDDTCSGTWFEGPWKKCTGICEVGDQKRDVICISKINNQFTVVDDYHCRYETKPVSEQRCALPECRPAWHTSNWSECSRDCGTGIQQRQVLCLMNEKEHHSCPAEKNPPTRQHCNMHPCKALAFGNRCQDHEPVCKFAYQRGLCKELHFSKLCCQTCYNRK